MKKTFIYKASNAAMWVFTVFGASAFLLTVMALCGREIMKSMENGTHERFVIVKDGKAETDDCRFHEGGKCTFGDGAPECAHEKKDGGKDAQ